MKKREQVKFVAAIRNENSFTITDMPEKYVDEAPAKSYNVEIKGKRKRIYIVQLSGKKHRNAVNVTDLSKKHQALIAEAIKEGVEEIFGI